MENYDCGFITAFRSQYNKKDNEKRNRQLKAKLLSDGFGVTDVKGSYVENYGRSDAKEVGESSFFIADLKDSGKLKKKLMEYGELYDQDSVLFVSKGGIKGILIGTNDIAEFPGKGNEIAFNNPVFGKSGEFMTRVRNRPFIFKESLDVPKLYDGNYLSRMGLRAYTNRDWRNT